MPHFTSKIPILMQKERNTKRENKTFRNRTPSRESTSTQNDGNIHAIKESIGKRKTYDEPKSVGRHEPKRTSNAERSSISDGTVSLLISFNLYNKQQSARRKCENESFPHIVKRHIATKNEEEQRIRQNRNQYLITSHPIQSPPNNEQKSVRKDEEKERLPDIFQNHTMALNQKQQRTKQHNTHISNHPLRHFYSYKERNPARIRGGNEDIVDIAPVVIVTPTQKLKRIQQYSKQISGKLKHHLPSISKHNKSNERTLCNGHSSGRSSFHAEFPSNTLSLPMESETKSRITKQLDKINPLMNSDINHINTRSSLERKRAVRSYRNFATKNQGLLTEKDNAYEEYFTSDESVHDFDQDYAYHRYSNVSDKHPKDTTRFIDFIDNSKVGESKQNTTTDSDYDSELLVD